MICTMPGYKVALSQAALPSGMGSHVTNGDVAALLAEADSRGMAAIKSTGEVAGLLLHSEAPSLRPAILASIARNAGISLLDLINEFQA